MTLMRPSPISCPKVFSRFSCCQGDVFIECSLNGRFEVVVDTSDLNGTFSHAELAYDPDRGVVFQLVRSQLTDIHQGLEQCLLSRQVTETVLVCLLFSGSL